MNSIEFIEYIKTNIGVENLSLSEKETLNYYIYTVKMIEKLNEECYGSDMDPPQYFKVIMLPEDYTRIISDYRNIRIIKLYNLMNEKKKELKKLELSENDKNIISEDYLKKYAKGLNLEFYRDRHDKLQFK